MNEIVSGEPTFRLPSDPATKVWRYMALWKFEWLLQQRSLYLRRADLLEDQFEGRFPQRQIESQSAWLIERGYKTIAIEEAQTRRRDRRRTYLNCWSIGEYDFDLMWKAYAADPDAIAIASTLGRLQQACSTESASDLEPLSLGQVDYLDLAGGQHIDYPNRAGVFFKKDCHFQLENELRIVHWPNLGDPLPPEHMALPIDVSRLIVAVVLSPLAPSRFAAGVQKLLERYDVSGIPLMVSRQSRRAVD